MSSSKSRVTVAGEYFRVYPQAGTTDFSFEVGEKWAENQTFSEGRITVELNDEEWRVLLAMKEELQPNEIIADPWTSRAEQAGVTLPRFLEVAETLNAKKVIGRISTFLEHIKPSETGKRAFMWSGVMSTSCVSMFKFSSCMVSSPTSKTQKVQPEKKPRLVALQFAT